jgi:hypothetical protein
MRNVTIPLNLKNGLTMHHLIYDGVVPQTKYPIVFDVIYLLRMLGECARDIGDSAKQV